MSDAESATFDACQHELLEGILNRDRSAVELDHRLSQTLVIQWLQHGRGDPPGDLLYIAGVDDWGIDLTWLDGSLHSASDDRPKSETARASFKETTGDSFY